MFDIMLSLSDSGPLYMKLYRHIREQILNGNIKDGSKLPSIRSLIQQQRFSKTTIETAYQLLVEEGYVLSKPRSGLYVVNPKLNQPLRISNVTPTRSEQIPLSIPTTISATTSVTNINETPYLSEQQMSFIDFSLLAVDGDSFPTQAWRSVLSESLLNNGTSIHQYGDSRGEYSLRVCLAQYLKSSRGVVCSPEQIIIGTGISYSIHILSRLLEQPATIAFEKAGIAQVSEIFGHNGFEIIHFPLHDHELSVAELEKKNIRAIYVTPSHRPTGNPLPYSIRQQLLHWASNNQAYIIEDDYDGEFRYSGLTIPSLQGIDQNGVVIYIGTFSKAFTPALRMNYVVVPIPLMEKLQSVERILSSPSRIDQKAMQLFIESGHLYRHIRRTRNIYRKKHERLTELLRINFPNDIQIQGDRGGLHLELTVHIQCRAEELIELAKTEGVRIYGSQHVGHNRNAEYPKIYMGFGGVTMEDMEHGVQRLRKAWSTLLE